MDDVARQDLASGRPGVMVAASFLLGIIVFAEAALQSFPTIAVTYLVKQARCRSSLFFSSSLMSAQSRTWSR